MPENSKITSQNTPGKALIKSQYLFHAEKSVDTSEPGVSEAKKPRIDEKKKFRGQNKNRFKNHVNHTSDRGPKLCHVLVDVAEGIPLPLCTYPGCRNFHNVKEYLEKKPADLGEECQVFLALGHCPRGVTCRFATQHITEDGRNKINAKLYKPQEKPKSVLSKEVQNLLRKRQYDFTKANDIVADVLKKLGKEKEAAIEEADVSIDKDTDKTTETAVVKEGEAKLEENLETDEKVAVVNSPAPQLGASCDDPNNREKKKIDWQNKLYLSPLTTLGNLPFRRICKEWGADITCGEMAMATSILQGVPSEWALLRRHSSEDLFGVQLCGNNPHVLARCALIVEETADADFIDLNLGCPIEMVYQKGGGSGLLRREKNLESVVRSMSLATKLPVTVKTRTGIYDDKRIAHGLMPLFTAAGASLITVHGRTREQRYTRHSDWEYIQECAKMAAPTPVFGNGDILSFHDYNSKRASHPNVAGVMIGRGALYKPWIFTEIKEQRDWDISSSERFEILRRFVHYGFEHWGSDTKGVENTRRFLLEWLSFLYRYIPVGLLECPPQRINERPSRYVGRDDLETLMASADCKDWVKISIMLCGPVPENFQFIPKHKANAWSSDSP